MTLFRRRKRLATDQYPSTAFVHTPRFSWNHEIYVDVPTLIFTIWRERGVVRKISVGKLYRCTYLFRDLWNSRSDWLSHVNSSPAIWVALNKLSIIRSIYLNLERYIFWWLETMFRDHNLERKPGRCISYSNHTSRIPTVERSDDLDDIFFVQINFHRFPRFGQPHQVWNRHYWLLPFFWEISPKYWYHCIADFLVNGIRNGMCPSGMSCAHRYIKHISTRIGILQFSKNEPDNMLLVPRHLAQ